MKVTSTGKLVQIDGVNILTDPIYSQRAGPLNLIGPRRVRQPAIAFDDLPPIAMVLLSHNHYDHCDVRTLRQLATRFDPLVVTPLVNIVLLARDLLRHNVEVATAFWVVISTFPVSKNFTG